MRVAAAQLAVGAELAANLAAILNTIGAAAQQKIKIVCFPECVLTGYTPASVAASLSAVPAALSQIGAACAAHQIAAVIGTAIRSDSGQVFNSAVVFDERGNR